MQAYGERTQYEQMLIASSPHKDNPLIRKFANLVLAADQFIVKRTLTDGSRMAVQRYSWLPLVRRLGARYNDFATRSCYFGNRPTRAGGQSLAYIRSVHEPRHVAEPLFPTPTKEPEYNTVDATLWVLPGHPLLSRADKR